MTPQRSRRIRLNQDPVYRRRRLVAGLLSAALVVALLASIVVAWRSASTSARTAASSVTATLPVTATPGETAPPTEQATPTPTEASPTASPTPAHRERITITFAGDVHFEDQVRANLTNPSANLPALRDVLSASTFTMANLETALTERGTPIAGKTYTFRAAPSALTFLKDLGVDAVSMANNHAADFGSVGLQDTLAAKASGVLPIVGLGTNIEDALTPLTVDIGGVRTAIFATSDLNDETSSQFSATATRPGIVSTNGTAGAAALAAAVTRAKADHELVIVFPHWGTETQTCPNDSQRRNAKALAAAGADIVVGGHAHRVQGSGWSGTTFVGYGLGNFIWYNNRGSSADTGVLTITVEPDVLAKRAAGETTGSPVVAETWTPMLIQRDGIPVAATGSAGRLMTAKQAANTCSGLAQQAP